jgi:segregation and condensation protein A
VTIREKIHSIVNTLRRYGITTFRAFINQRHDRLEVVVTFLAMLELIKRSVVEASQQELFGEIELKSTGEWDEKEDAQLEFIE